MPASPYVICLDDAARAELEAVSRRATAPFRLVQRARIVLLAASGLENRVIADRLGVCDDTARKWRRRYCQGGLTGLADAPRPWPAADVPRPGRRRGQGPGVRAARRQREAAGPLDLPRAGPARGRRRHLSPSVSASTVRRWLAERRAQAVAAPVVDLPPRPALRPQGRPRPGPLPAGMGRTAARRRRVRAQRGREARRPGPLACPPPAAAGAAAGDAGRERVRTAAAPSPTWPPTTSTAPSVFGRCEPSTGIKPFTALVDQVMSTEPYASAKRVFWVVDNGASHRNWAAADRPANAHPNAQMVHLPVHASWLNQVVRHEVACEIVALVEGRPADVGDVVPGPVRKDRPRPGVRCG